jgi:hypothetical protein
VHFCKIACLHWWPLFCKGCWPQVAVFHASPVPDLSHQLQTRQRRSTAPLPGAFHGAGSLFAGERLRLCRIELPGEDQVRGKNRKLHAPAASSEPQCVLPSGEAEQPSGAQEVQRRHSSRCAKPVSPPPDHISEPRYGSINQIYIT